LREDFQEDVTIEHVERVRAQFMVVPMPPCAETCILDSRSGAAPGAFLPFGSKGVCYRPLIVIAVGGLTSDDFLYG
jgi:hypothetical protein